MVAKRNERNEWQLISGKNLNVLLLLWIRNVLKHADRDFENPLRNVQYDLQMALIFFSYYADEDGGKETSFQFRQVSSKIWLIEIMFDWLTTLVYERLLRFRQNGI